ncbi:MAG: hypothetical protein ACRECX_13615 [Methyloceanibacter sp.]|uniref:hypothetical protein n=1 Tax=Methyloceanibacter sp. TaxID=1965321 RepID=UPI003D6D7580
MKAISTLMTAAAALAIGFGGVAYAEEAPGAKSDILIVEATSDAPGGTGVDESAGGEGATQKGDNQMPDEGASSGQAASDPTGKEPGTGVEDSVQGEGATAKQGLDDAEEGKDVNLGGDSSGNAPGGTGVEKSAEGEGAKNKTVPN